MAAAKPMRVNIITQPLFCNYGGILQNFALQQVIRQLGHEPLTINAPEQKIHKSPAWKVYARTILNLLAKLRGNYSAPFLNPRTFALKEKELSFPQREFIRKYINKADCDVPFTADLENRFPADLWIVGSDQVWRPWCSPDIGNYFFNFLSDRARRISYAASFGTDKWEISEKQTPKVRELASKFQAVSVRESSGVGLCKDYLGVEAKHVLDPTMLINAEEYLALTSETDYPKKRYIATYVLDVSKEKSDIIKAESKKRKLPVVKVGVMHRTHFDPIESWLATIAHADCVITDSFHGTVFSLIFGRPVKVLKNGVRGNSRLDSLLEALRLVPDAQGFILPDKDNITRLNELRKASIDFINNSLIKND